VAGGKAIYEVNDVIVDVNIIRDEAEKSPSWKNNDRGTFLPFTLFYQPINQSANRH